MFQSSKINEKDSRSEIRRERGLRTGVYGQQAGKADEVFL